MMFALVRPCSLMQTWIHLCCRCHFEWLSIRHSGLFKHAPKEDILLCTLLPSSLFSCLLFTSFYHKFPYIFNLPTSITQPSPVLILPRICSLLINIYHTASTLSLAIHFSPVSPVTPIISSFSSRPPPAPPSSSFSLLLPYLPFLKILNYPWSSCLAAPPLLFRPPLISLPLLPQLSWPCSLTSIIFHHPFCLPALMGLDFAAITKYSIEFLRRTHAK